MMFPWDYYGILMAFLWDFHDVSMLFLWIPMGSSMGTIYIYIYIDIDLYGIFMGCLCGSYAMSMYFSDRSMGFLWDSMICL